MIRTRAVAAAVATAALVFALPGFSAAHTPGALEAPIGTQTEAPEPTPDILLPDGDPLLPAEADVRAQVAPGEVTEIGVASSDGPAGLTISTVTAVGPDEALALVDELAAEPDTLAVGLPQPIYTQGTPAAAPLAEVTTPAAVDPYRPEDTVFPFPWNQYPPDMLCTDSIAGASSRYGCSAYAWQYSTGAGQVVAVLDQGVDTSHPDLAAAIVPGASCLEDGCTAVVETAPDHRADHGTHVAGIIAATTNNGIGVAGMAPSAQIMPVEVIGPTGVGMTTWLAEGIDWAVDNGANVINMSLGTRGGPSDPVLEVAVAHAHYLQVALVAAVGNDGPDSNRISLSGGLPGCGRRRQRRLGEGDCLQLQRGAVGSTSWPLGRGCSRPSTRPTSGALMAGTRAPRWPPPTWPPPWRCSAHQRPTDSPERLANLLYSTAQDLGGAGWDSTYGHGLIRPVAALQEPYGGWRAGRLSGRPSTPSNRPACSTPAPIRTARSPPARPARSTSARRLARGDPIVPDGAVAIAYNLTIPTPVASGHLRVMPGDTAYSMASAINVASNQTIANGLVVKIDQYKEIRVYNALGTPVHAVVDVMGYFLSGDDGGSFFTPIAPTRVHDSDLSGGRIVPGETRTIAVHTGLEGQQNVVPVGASAIAYNITVVEPGSVGHLRVMPGDVLETSSSAINWLRIPATRSPTVSW